MRGIRGSFDLIFPWRFGLCVDHKELTNSKESANPRSTADANGVPWIHSFGLWSMYLSYRSISRRPPTALHGSRQHDGKLPFKAYYVFGSSGTRVSRGLRGGDGSCSGWRSRLKHRGDFDFERSESLCLENSRRLCRLFTETMQSSLSSSLCRIRQRCVGKWRDRGGG
jgi:hypothetical protein